jgi:hypothetical protein
MKRLIERIDSRLEGIDSRLEGIDEKMRLNTRALDSTLDAVNSQSRAIQHMLARLPPLADNGV